MKKSFESKSKKKSKVSGIVAVTLAVILLSGVVLGFLSKGFKDWNTLAWFGNAAQAVKGDKGDKGEKGDTGAQGLQGEKGATGERGADGVKGDTGVSAYQTWLDMGNTGTESDFIDWLKGADGKDGKDLRTLEYLLSFPSSDFYDIWELLNRSYSTTTADSYLSFTGRLDCYAFFDPAYSPSITNGMQFYYSAETYRAGHLDYFELSFVSFCFVNGKVVSISPYMSSGFSTDGLFKCCSIKDIYIKNLAHSSGRLWAVFTLLGGVL